MIHYCQKRPVSAVVTLKDGKVLMGGNFGLRAVAECPRVPGEGYAKCFTECGQLNHAEAMVLRMLRTGGYTPEHVRYVDVYGHNQPCESCKLALRAARLLDMTRFHPNASPSPINKEIEDDVNKEYSLVAPPSHSRYAGGEW